MIWGWHSYVEWRQQNYSICKSSFLGRISGIVLLFSLVIVPLSASSIHHGAPPQSSLSCNHRENWVHAGLRREEFENLFRPFRLWETSSSELEESGSQCKSCYAIWKTDELGQREVVQQGCLFSQDGCDAYPCETLNHDINSPNDAFHVAQLPHEIHPNLERKSTSINLNFCCCNHPSDHCNQVNKSLSPKRVSSSATNYISSMDILGNTNSSGSLPTIEMETFSQPDQNHILPYALSIFAFVLIIFAAAICIVRYFRFDQRCVSMRKRDIENATSVSKDNQMMKELSSSYPAMPDNLTTSSSITMPSDLSDIKVSSEVGEGRFGCVIYKAILGSKPVAVKSYPVSRKQDYFNEREVYELMSQKSQQDLVKNFLIYYGSGEDLTSKDGVNIKNFVVLESSENGYLSDFLGRMTISWSDLCKMLSSISQGLSYLHGFGRLKEPSLCHRNINGSNILVKRDMSCSLCNFNHVVVTNSSGQPFLLSQYSSSTNDDFLEHDAEPQEDTSKNLVIGSPRYLAPEVLDHALNLQQGEVSLKQVDVYAMGLVFWELSRRCRDLYQGVSVPNHEMVFDHELGSQRLNPTIEQMQILVSRYRARPLFPEVWKNSNPAIQRLRETIEDSWDQDGEARLSAFCIVERIHELDGLWERYRKSSSIYNHGASQTNILPSNNNMQTIARLDSSEREEVSLSSAINRSQIFHCNHLHTNRPKNVLDLGKNLSTKGIKNSNILSRQQTIAQIQPHQGRNPCIERNFMLDGNKTEGGESSPLLFIQGSAKDVPIPTGPRPENLQRSEYDELMADPALLTFSMGRQRHTTPQPIQLNVQNNFEGTDDQSSPSSVLGYEKEESKKIKLNSLWKKRQKAMSKEQRNHAIPKPKSDINLKWDKEYQAARMARQGESDEIEN